MNTVSNSSHENDLGRVLVVGLGVTGMSVIRYLSTRGGVCGVADTKPNAAAVSEIKALAPDAALYLGNMADVDCGDYDTVLLSPGVPRRSELVLRALELGLDVIGDIELFSRDVTVPVVSVTGSNGKSTVVHLLTEMAKGCGVNVALGGNFGAPALDVMNDDVELYVLELSSFQLESTESLKSRVASVLNISPDHMDRYESLAEYAGYKGRVFDNAEVQLVNRDDSLAKDLATTDEVLSFGLGSPRNDSEYGIRKLNGEQQLMKGDRGIMPINQLKLLGTHNQANALAALALGECVGLNETCMIQTLKEYTGLEHRTQWIAEHGNVTWVNDSKATNTGATIAALEGMPGPVVLIAGGQAKGETFANVSDVVAEYCRHVILLGEDAQLIADALEGKVEITFADNMQNAVMLASGRAKAGDVVLLSPACASFDMYSGYGARGEDFVAQVLKLTGGEA